jgi:hypothetical protein
MIFMLGALLPKAWDTYTSPKTGTYDYDASTLCQPGITPYDDPVMATMSTQKTHIINKEQHPTPSTIHQNTIVKDKNQPPYPANTYPPLRPSPPDCLPTQTIPTPHPTKNGTQTQNL